MKNIYITVGIVFALVVGGLFGYVIHTQKTVVQSFGAVGDTNSTRKIASCVLDMSTTTPTTATTTGTACLTNTDSKDRIVTSVEYYLSGLGSMTGSAGTGVASTTWQLSTSSGLYVGSANYLLNTTIATSTANGAVGGTLFIASSTPGSTATFPFRVWASGSNLNLFSNATSSAAGTVGTIVVSYFINN